MITEYLRRVVVSDSKSHSASQISNTLQNHLVPISARDMSTVLLFLLLSQDIDSRFEAEIDPATKAVGESMHAR